MTVTAFGSGGADAGAQRFWPALAAVAALAALLVLRHRRQAAPRASQCEASQ